MSHFTVLVIGNKPEEQLAPYHEFECTGDDNQYIQELDKTEELLEEYESVTTTKLIDKDGNYYNTYDDEFYREPTEEEKKTTGNFGSGFGNGISYTSKDWGDGLGYRAKVNYTPEGLTEVTVKRKDIESFAEFVSGWYGYEIVPFGEDIDLTDKHKYGYVLVDKNGEVTKVINRTNPNSKWDWFKLGGRWNGFFKLKSRPERMLKIDGRNFSEDLDMSNVVVGEGGVFGNSREDYGGRADQCKKRNVDFEGMYADVKAEADKRYTTFENATDGVPIPKKWSEYLKDFDDIQDARDVWAEEPWVRALRDARLSSFMGCDHEEYCVDSGGREQYLENSRCNAFQTFAVVKDGKWYEKGEMGWFGCVGDEKLKGDWSAQFQVLLEDLPKDTLLSVYDCHI